MTIIRLIKSSCDTYIESETLHDNEIIFANPLDILDLRKVIFLHHEVNDKGLLPSVEIRFGWPLVALLNRISPIHSHILDVPVKVLIDADRLLCWYAES